MTRWRYPYMTLTQLGECFGVSNQQVGRWLQQVGLRTPANKPSAAAFGGDYVKAGPSRGAGYNWVWASEKTVRALEDAGHTLAVYPASELLVPCRLAGPFESRPHPDFGHQIVNGDGTVAVWVRGEANASFLCRVLNLAHERGVIDRLLADGPAGPEPAP